MTKSTPLIIIPLKSGYIVSPVEGEAKPEHILVAGRACVELGSPYSFRGNTVLQAVEEYFNSPEAEEPTP